LVLAKIAVMRTSQMKTPDGHLIRKAFLTKYGYSPDLTYEEILCEFQQRYDLAQSMRLQNAGPHLVMLIIEGMPQGSAQEEASQEHDLRRLKIEGLTRESGYGVTELDQLVEGFAQRLETQWIQKI
jgi:hypothetical protein